MWVILAVVVAVALAAGLVLAVPRLRRLAAAKGRPKLRDIWGNFKVVASSPRKLVLLIGGLVARELLIAMALSVSLRAFDDHLRLPVLIVVITLAAMIGGASPSPGGMGVAEAGLILGLTAAGVAEADATAAVFIQRLFTSYLPPIWGWFTPSGRGNGSTCERSVTVSSAPASGRQAGSRGAPLRALPGRAGHPQ